MVSPLGPVAVHVPIHGVHISVRALDCKTSAIGPAQQLVSVQQLTFLPVFFSPKLRLKSYYF